MCVESVLQWTEYTSLCGTGAVLMIGAPNLTDCLRFVKNSITQLHSKVLRLKSSSFVKSLSGRKLQSMKSIRT